MVAERRIVARYWDSRIVEGRARERQAALYLFVRNVFVDNLFVNNLFVDSSFTNLH